MQIYPNIAQQKRLIALVLLVVAILWSVLFTSYGKVYASDMWSSGSFAISSEAEERLHARQYECKQRFVRIVGVTDTPEDSKVCVYERPQWRYARYTKRIEGYVTRYESYFVVGIGEDSAMYVVEDIPANLRNIDIPGSNDLIFNYLTDAELRIIKEFPKQLVLTYSGPGLAKRYKLKDDSTQPLISGLSSDNLRTTYSIGVSKNGAWIAVEDQNSGMILINTRTYELIWFSDYKRGFGYVPPINLVVSNDGRFVAMLGYNIESRIYTLNSECVIKSYEYDDEFLQAAWAAPSCPDDGGRMQEAFASRFSSMHARELMDFPDRFSDDGKVLYFLRVVDPTEPTHREYEVELRSSSYDPAEYTKQYLALGDSISSGEGDIGKDKEDKKYYRQYTDVNEKKDASQPREKCHLSTRSYPYLLASWMQLSRDAKQWDSVACSGAKSSDVVSLDGVEYEGQAKGAVYFWENGDEPRLRGFDNKYTLQATALNEVIPGRVQQVEFVRKYKPKVITLTAGANNIRFSDKLSACLRPGTCSWATSSKSSLASQIQNEYDSLRDLYEDLFEASNKQSKIYVIGYPYIISRAEPAKCELNVGSLDKDERIMIYEATSYLNMVIERAANAAGVRYVDISDALDGGKLCEEGQEYMTGIAQRGSNEIQESFHPNDFGHIKITQKIKEVVGNSDLKEYDICPDTTDAVDKICPKASDIVKSPDIPEYFGVPNKPSRNVDMTQPILKKGQPFRLQVPTTTVAPFSTSPVLARSDPTLLGHVVANAEGGLDAMLNLSISIPAGFHTIILDGESYSGEPIELMQTVLILGQNPDDIDENGIEDSFQACGPFLISSEQDVDRDGIDDACDPVIGRPHVYSPEMPLPHGEVSRNLNVAEHEDIINGIFQNDITVIDSVGALFIVPNVAQLHEVKPSASLEAPKQADVNGRGEPGHTDFVSWKLFMGGVAIVTALWWAAQRYTMSRK